MSQTKIEWAEHVWNPVTGCTPVGAGCDNCYAERMAGRFSGRTGFTPKPEPLIAGRSGLQLSGCKDFSKILMK